MALLHGRDVEPQSRTTKPEAICPGLLIDDFLKC